MAVYLDCNATTPLEPGVAALVARFMERDFGNAASPVHDFGIFARMAVEHARGQVAELVAARRDEVLFTSGATEANNLAILGLAGWGRRQGRRHLLATAIEHKSVLEPLASLAEQGFELELLPVDGGGRFDPAHLRAALRPDTLLVSTMQVNNETGVSQPLAECAGVLAGHPAFWHVDAAQGFGKELAPPRLPRPDLISISGHKVYGPKGIGALVARKRDGALPPLTPLMYGGGQEQGLRPGTLPVPLIAGLGEAAKLALRHHEERAAACRAYRRDVLAAMERLGARLNGDQTHVLPHTVSVSLPGIPATQAIAAVKGLIAVSGSSACTAHSTAPSHVLTAMGLDADRLASSLRISWSHLTPPADWDGVVSILERLRAA